MSRSKKNSLISSQVYDKDYFLVSMEGAKEFSLSKGQKLPRRMEYAFNLAGVKPGQKVLDIGCGRGEIAFQCARQNAYVHGLDFSDAAIQIAKDLKIRALESGIHFELERAEARHLPYSDNSFDIVFMLDIIEHLYPHELLEILLEVRRVLSIDGHLIIHTMPNEDYYRWGYPVYRIFMGWRGQKLPQDPRQRWYRGETHVNIQNPRKLRKTLLEAGFSQVRVWLHPIQGNIISRLILGMPPLRWILINDILARAIKT